MYKIALLRRHFSILEINIDFIKYLYQTSNNNYVHIVRSDERINRNNFTDFRTYPTLYDAYMAAKEIYKPLWREYAKYEKLLKKDGLIK